MIMVIAYVVEGGRGFWLEMFKNAISIAKPEHKQNFGVGHQILSRVWAWKMCFFGTWVISKKIVACFF